MKKNQNAALGANFREKYLNQKIPFSVLGDTKTLKGTNNKFWFVYLPRWKTTFQSVKELNIIIKMWSGKRYPRKNDIEKPNVDPKILKDILTKNKRITCLKWYQRVYGYIYSQIKTWFLMPYIIIRVFREYRKIKKQA